MFIVNVYADHNITKQSVISNDALVTNFAADTFNNTY